MSVLALSPFDLAIAATLVLALAALSLRLQLGVERQLLFSAARSTLQLLLIGVVLKVLFENAQLLWVALMAGVMIMLAGGKSWCGRNVGWSAAGDSESEPCRSSSRRSRLPSWHCWWSSAAIRGTRRNMRYRCSA